MAKEIHFISSWSVYNEGGGMEIECLNAYGSHFGHNLDLILKINMKRKLGCVYLWKTSGVFQKIFLLKMENIVFYSIDIFS